LSTLLESEFRCRRSEVDFPACWNRKPRLLSLTSKMARQNNNSSFRMQTFRINPTAIMLVNMELPP
jgi:hypothetical protein